MKVRELLDVAKNSSGEEILLTVVRDRLPTGGSVRLFGKRGPTSTVICNIQSRDDERYEVTAWFSADKIEKYIVDNLSENE